MCAFRAWISDKGLIVGSYETEHKETLLQEELRYIRNFLAMVNKKRANGQVTAKPVNADEVVNIVRIQGKLKADPKDFGTAVGALVDIKQKTMLKVQIYTGEKSEYLSLAKRLQQFRAGDVIQIRGRLRPWAKKNDTGTWYDGLNVDVLEIVNDPPVRAKTHSTQEESEPESEGIPF